VANVSEEILDDIISNDVRLARIEAGVRRKVSARINELFKDLSALLFDVDPMGVERRDARQRRLDRLERESRELIRQAYADINRLVRNDMVKLGAVETAAIASIIEGNLP
jgi:hypothetical protein